MITSTIHLSLCFLLSVYVPVSGNFKIRKMENTINHIFIEIGKFRRDLAFVETRIDDIEEHVWNITAVADEAKAGSSTDNVVAGGSFGNKAGAVNGDIDNKMRMVMRSLSKEKLLIRDMMAGVEKMIKQGGVGEDLEGRISELERKVGDDAGQFDYVEQPRPVIQPRNNDRGDVKYSFSTRLDRSRDIMPDPRAKRQGHRMHSKLIPFSNVIHNDGDVYNPITGKFTCKRDGVYLFVFFVEGIFRKNRPINGQTSMVALSVDGKYQTLAASKAFSADGRNTGGNSVVLKLIKGQQVWLETVGPISQMVTLREWVSTFSGVLLY